MAAILLCLKTIISILPGSHRNINININVLNYLNNIKLFNVKNINILKLSICVICQGDFWFHFLILKYFGKTV